MAELAPTLIHPIMQKSISELLAGLKSPYRVALARADRTAAKSRQARGPFTMKFFVDSADANEIREVASWGLADGVTTNPSLIAKTGRPYDEVLREICDALDGPVSAEVVSTEAPAMLEEGEKLARLHRNIVVKCPMTIAGLKATKALTAPRDQGQRHADLQPAAGIGGGQMWRGYISPFAGRLDDMGQDGMLMVEQLVHILGELRLSRAGIGGVGALADASAAGGGGGRPRRDAAV